jgi:PKD domain-containing protein
MRKKPWALPATLRLVVCGAVVAVSCIAVGAGGATAQDEQPGNLQGAFQSEPVTPAKLNIDLSTLTPIPPGPFVPASISPDDPGEEGPGIGGPEGGGVAAAQQQNGTKLAAADPPEEFTSPSPNFNGIGYTALVPPDTNGDVGPKNYIQMVNSRFEIFNKQGVALAGPANISSLWSAAGFPGPCATRNDGDPVVVYDNLADRWLMSQFANPTGFSTPPTHECIAVSQTGNPVTGGWFLYDFTFNFAHDYPKIGVWPDGYYMSSQRGFPGGSLNAVVFDRARMLAGNPATFQSFNPAGPALILLPSDLDGPAPPAGTPDFFARAVDGGLWGGTDRVDLFAFHVDWGNPALSTFTTLPSVATAANDQNLCGGAGLFDNCVPQPGTSTVIETLPHWSQGHLQYRNFGTRETLVFDHTVDADNTDHAGVQWFELNRPPLGAWSMFQQGTYAPDASHRWMGSIAMDRLGDLALAYSISNGTSIFPGISYTGRQTGDPLGTMPQPETSLVNGLSAQTFNGSRWGDYASMTVDPVDDCRFWFTSEYMGGGGFWATRIGSFRFSACDVPITASGTTINSVEGAPFSGTVATVTDPDTNATAAEYTATIDWGDGSATSAGVLSGPAGGPFPVSGSHTYAEEGTYTVTVTVTDTDTPSNSATATTTAKVADASLTAGALTLSAGVEGVTPVNATFAFTDANTGAPTSDFSVTCNWGDATTSAGTVSGSGGSFTAGCGHVYLEEGSYTVTVTVLDDGGSSTVATGTTTVADAPLTASCGVGPASPLSFAGGTATFTDADPNGIVTDYAATIDWGDGTPVSTGTISGGPGNGPYTVSGTHTYATAGVYTITTTTVDHPSSATVACQTTIFAFAPGGGAFVIGDLNGSIGTTVTFWGAQWSSLNALSGGLTPPAFKGFARNPSTPSCGTDWSTGPGNSSDPPAGSLPSFMGVIVSSSIAKSGSTIHGNTVHVAVVQTDPGYDGNPGHAGTGKVVALFC